MPGPDHSAAQFGYAGGEATVSGHDGHVAAIAGLPSYQINYRVVAGAPGGVHAYRWSGWDAARRALDDQGHVERSGQSCLG